MKRSDYQPITQVWLNRALISLIVVLTILAGFLSDLLNQQTKLYNNLEDRYIRIQHQLGKKEVQRLIEQSYEQ
jgi:hypothetical protein